MVKLWSYGYTFQGIPTGFVMITRRVGQEEENQVICLVTERMDYTFGDEDTCWTSKLEGWKGQFWKHWF